MFLAVHTRGHMQLRCVSSQHFGGIKFGLQEVRCTSVVVSHFFLAPTIVLACMLQYVDIGEGPLVHHSSYIEIGFTIS
jgi:small basic protein